MSAALPDHFESERLRLRSYRPGDGPLFYAVGQKNRAHLEQFEAENVILSAKDEAAAEAIVCELANDWQARKCFFIGAFDKRTGEFVAQVYVGMANPDLPEYEIGYFVDKEHEGQGYVTEAASAAIQFVFEQLGASRLRLACDDTNERSYRVAERCGLIREGHSRENKRHPDGTVSGTLHYRLLKSEFEALQTTGKGET